MSGVKHDAGKAPLDLLPPRALVGAARVFAFGMIKYGRGNWARGIAWLRLGAALFRHWLAFTMGEDLDPESGEPHVHHMGCCVMMLQEMYETRKDLDDRIPEFKINNPLRLTSSSKETEETDKAV